jgi:hypothetical protein
MARAKLPLSAFDPRYKDLLLRGAQEDFRLACSDLAEATRLRQDIHRFRKLFTDQHKDEGGVLYQCLVTIESVGESTFLRFRPRSQQFSALDSIARPSPGTPSSTPVSNSILDELAAEQPKDEPK